MRRARRPPGTPRIETSTDAIPFGNCPECSKPVEVAIDEDGRPTAVIHVMPLCGLYDRLPAHEYLNVLLTVREAARRPVAGHA